MTQSPAPTASLPPLLEVRAGIARITLRRPQQRNRLEDEDLATLLAHFAALDADPAVRVVVLAAEVLEHRPVFSAGYHFGELDATAPRVDFETVADTLERLRPVTVCELSGSVYGGATDFVLACDVALGAEGMEARMPAAALGLHYYPSGLQRYVSRLGVSAARRMFLTAEAIDDHTLLRMGYLQELLPRAALRQRVDALAAHVASLAPLALGALKLSMNELARGDFDRARLQERTSTTMASQDFIEGRRAFQERRVPRWEGR